MAERARRDHHVGAGLDRLLDRLDDLAERRLLTRRDDREAAALDLRRVVDRLAAAGLDDPLERPRPVRILEAHDLRRAQDLAAVERRDLQPLQPAVRDLLQPLVAVALGDLPEEVPHLDVAGVRRNAHGREVLVDAGEQLGVALEHEVRLAQVERADVADRHEHLAAGRLGVGEDPRVEVEVVVRLRLVDVAGAAAGDRLELHELEPDHRRERLRRAVELLRGQRREAALVVGDSLHRCLGRAHAFASSSTSGSHGLGAAPGRS